MSVCQVRADCMSLALHLACSGRKAHCSSAPRSRVKRSDNGKPNWKPSSRRLAPNQSFKPTPTARLDSGVGAHIETFMRWNRIATRSTLLFVTGATLLAVPLIASTLRNAEKPGEENVPRYSPVSAFRHIGVGDLDTCTSARYPMVDRAASGRASTFLVRASVACGLEVRNPVAYVQGDTLHLGYETHFTGGVDMCNCEYRSVFAVVDLPRTVTKVEFTSTFIDSAP